MKVNRIITLLILAFWTCYFMYDIVDKEKSCVNVTSSMYCPKNYNVSQGELHFYHTIAISSLSFCFMVTIHMVFCILNHQELSMMMMITTSIIMALFAFSHWGAENFMFHCIGFLIGIYGANLFILIHIIVIFCQAPQIGSASSVDSVNIEEVEDGIPDAIELRNNQPGYFFDINTRTHILNFDIN